MFLLRLVQSNSHLLEVFGRRCSDSCSWTVRVAILLPLFSFKLLVRILHSSLACKTQVIQSYFLIKKNATGFWCYSFNRCIQKTKDQSQTCMLAFFLNLFHRMFLLRLPGRDRYSPRNVWVKVLMWSLYPLGAL